MDGCRVWARVVSKSVLKMDLPEAADWYLATAAPLPPLAAGSNHSLAAIYYVRATAQNTVEVAGD